MRITKEYCDCCGTIIEPTSINETYDIIIKDTIKYEDITDITDPIKRDLKMWNNGDSIPCNVTDNRINVRRYITFDIDNDKLGYAAKKTAILCKECFRSIIDTWNDRQILAGITNSNESGQSN